MSRLRSVSFDEKYAREAILFVQADSSKFDALLSITNRLSLQVEQPKHGLLLMEDNLFCITNGNSDLVGPTEFVRAYIGFLQLAAHGFKVWGGLSYTAKFEEDSPYEENFIEEILTWNNQSSQSHLANQFYETLLFYSELTGIKLVGDSDFSEEKCKYILTEIVDKLSVHQIGKAA